MISAAEGRKLTRRKSRQEHDGSSLTGALLALTVSVVVAPHLLAGVFAWGTTVIAVAVTVALAVLVVETKIRGRALARMGEPVFILLALPLFATVMQTVPLPAHWIGSLVPYSADFPPLLGQPSPSWLALSLDPGNTYERVLFGVAVVGSFFVARVLSTNGSGTEVLIAIAASVALTAASHLGHRLVDASRVYGLYEPLIQGATGPLLNQNNRAGFMALGAPLCLAFAVKHHGGFRLLWGAATLLILATGLLSGSRAGAAVLVGGPLLLIILHSLNRRSTTTQSRERSQSAVPRRAASLMLVGVVLIAAAFGLAALAQRDFLETDYSDLTKLTFLRAQLELLHVNVARSLVGYGRGAFAMAFEKVHAGPERALFSECLPLQYAVDLGLPVTATVFVGIALQIAARFRRWRSLPHLGGLVGLVALAMQNLLDFGLELSGIAVPAAACFGAALPSARGTAAGSRLVPDPSAIAEWVAGGAIALTAIFALPAWKADLLRAERQLLSYVRDRRPDAFWLKFGSVAPAHPAEPTLATLAAAEMVLEGKRDALAWLNRAMLLAPGWAGPHYWAARWLAERGRWSQATMELQLAASAGARDAATLLCEWVKMKPSAGIVFESAPTVGAMRLELLDAGGRCLERVPDEAERVDSVILAESPQHLGSAMRAVRRAMARHDLRVAQHLARTARRSHVHDSAPYLAEADVALAMSQPIRAEAVLKEALQHVETPWPVLEMLAHVQAIAKDDASMRETIAVMRGTAAGNVTRLASACMLLARLELSLGNNARALRALREAYLVGAQPGMLSETATVALQLGQVDFAMNVWSHLCDQHPDEKTYCERRDALRAQLGSSPN